MFKDVYKSLFITIGDIPLTYSQPRKEIVVDITKLAKFLVKRLQVPETIINEIITKIFNSSGDALFSIKEKKSAEDVLTELIRVLKMNARPYIINEKFSDLGYPVINFNEYYSLDDIKASYTFASWMNVEGGKAYIDFRDLLAKLVNKGIVESSEILEVSRQLTEAIQKDPKYSAALLSTTIKEYSDRVSRIAAKYIDLLITDRWLMNYNNGLLDEVSTPYISVDDNGEYEFAKGDSIKKLASLMLILGYKIDGFDFDDANSNITKILNSTLTYLNNNGELQDELRINARIANALLLNSLHGNVDANDFDPSLTRMAEFSQLEVELVMFDVAVSIMDVEKLLATAISEIGCKREDIYDDMVEFIDSFSKEFSVIVKTQSHNPFKVLEFAMEKAENKVQELKAYHDYKAQTN